MKRLTLLGPLFASFLAVFPAEAQNAFSLVPVTTFGSHGDGSLQPGDTSWITVGNNQRGFGVDPTTTNLVIVDTQSGSGGSSAVQGTITVADGNTGAALGTLNTTNIVGGSYADSAATIADDGVVYICNQVVASTVAVKIYRWDSINSTNPPVVAFSNTIAPTARYGITLEARGAGTNTQLIMGSSQLSGGVGSNVVIFTTTDATNFTAHLLSTDTGANFGDGLAWGPGNTFYAKNFNAPLRLMGFDLNTNGAYTIRSYDSGAANMVNSESLGPIAVETNLHLLAALDAPPNVTTRKYVRLYDISNTNIAPVLLDIKQFNYDPPVGPGTAPAGVLRFSHGRLYAFVMNNGLMAFDVASTPAPPPIIIAQPLATNKVAIGQSLSLTVLAYPAATYQWTSNNVSIPGATNGTLTLNNIQTSFAASYAAIVSNPGGSLSVTSVVQVVNPADLYHLNLLWRASATDGKPFLDATPGGNTPSQRGIGYNALSNHLYVVSRGSTGGVQNSNYAIYVLNATNGNVLWTLNTNGIVPYVISDVAGANGVALTSIAAAEDGAVYAANLAPDAIGGIDVNYDTNKTFKVWRWANDNSNTLPQLIFQGEPTQDTVSNRWGDVIAVRGSGAGTQILLDVHTSTSGGLFRKAALLTPTDQYLTNWVYQWFFVNNSGGNPGSIGRSLQFEGNNNIIYEKRKNGGLVKTAFTPLVNPQTSGQIDSSFLASYTNFPNGLQGVAVDPSRTLVAGVFTNGLATAPDALNLYDISAPLSPLLLASYSFPKAPRNPNANFISQTIISGDLLMSLDANNGIMVFRIATGPLQPPQFVTQPQDIRVIEGGSGTLSATTLESANYQWQKGTVNITDATNSSYTLVNATANDAGQYRVIATNVFSGSATSAYATVTVVLKKDIYSLSNLWNAAPGSVAYSTSTGGNNTPNERTLAYYAPAKELYVVQRIATTANYAIYVIDATTGAILRTLNTNGVNLTVPAANGATGIALDAIGVSDDGSIYVSNLTGDGCGCLDPNGAFRIYRWADSGASTAPVLVFSGDPAGQTTSLRWGDVMSVRGGGVNTEILLDNQQSTFGAVLKPTDASLTGFVAQPFASGGQITTIGRSLQWAGTTNIWQKRKGDALRLSGYDLTSQTTALLSNYTVFPNTLGPVAIDSSRNLLAGINFVDAGSDTLDLYDVSSFSLPLLIASYPFPSVHQANANFVGQVLFAGNKVFAVDGNNGVLAMTINDPQLRITVSGNNAVLTWPLFSGFVLQATPALGSPSVWTNVPGATIVGGQNQYTTPATGMLFYRLKK